MLECGMTLGARALLAILAGSLLLPSAGRLRAEAPASESAKEFAAALLAETNRVRKRHGISPLRPRAELNLAADDQAALMALMLSSRHDSPVPGRETPWERVRRRGYEAAKVAENVASIPVGKGAQRQSVEQIVATLVEQWLESPGHRANLLSRELTYFGASVRLSRLPGDLWCAFGVQVFCAPAPRGRGI
jgi:uncharacterized protein YkwD